MSEDQSQEIARLRALLQEAQSNRKEAELNRKKAELNRKKAELNRKIAELNRKKAESYRNKANTVALVQNFILKNQINSTESAIFSSIVKIKINDRDLKRILTQHSVNMIDVPDWINYRDSIIDSRDVSLTKRKGYHPLMINLINNFDLQTNSQYQMVYEKSFTEDEDILIKIPDISIVNKGESSKKMSSIKIPIEIKKYEKIGFAIRQAFSYLLEKILDQWELVSDDQTLFGFCVGTDTFSMIIGYASVNFEERSILLTQGTPISLWPNDAKQLSEAPEGINLLYSLLLASPESLGISSDQYNMIDFQGHSFRLMNVLGRGAFGVAIETLLEPSNDIMVIKRILKCSSLLNSHHHTNELCHLENEFKILKHFRGANCPLLPSTCFLDWIVTPEYPFIPLSPSGINLIRYSSMHLKRNRLSCLEKLRNDLYNSLKAAHNLGYCHTDLKPDNIIYDPNTLTFMPIDWGLARVEHTFMHSYFGGMDFFADDILNFINEGNNFIENTLQIPYKKEYDLESVKYIVYVFHLSKPGLMTPWSTCELKRPCSLTLSQRRQEYLNNKSLNDEAWTSLSFEY